jgi:predicted Rossmann fold nucleotide-binding protein DprA/Smf involved in DNA uptake
VLSGRNRGAHALLRDGAKIVESADDILEELGWAQAAASDAGRDARCRSDGAATRARVPDPGEPAISTRLPSDPG